MNRIVRRAALLFFRAYLPLVASIGTVLWVLYASDIKSTKLVIASDQKHDIRLAMHSIQLELELVRNDLSYLVEHGPLQNWLVNADPQEFETLERDILAFSKHRQAYDQVRYLDSTGMEVVRVNWARPEPLLIPMYDLQDKSKRYYFSDAVTLSSGQIYSSALDLNIEKGRLEKPIKPVIRFAAPVFDRNGKNRGIIVLNYKGARLLNLIERVQGAEENHLQMINSSGYWLLGPNPDAEWGFMIDARAQNTFPNLYGNELWEKISSGKQEDQFSNSAELVSYARLSHDQSISVPQYSWILISIVPLPHYTSRSQYLLLMFIFISILLAGTCYLFVQKGMVKQKFEMLKSIEQDRYRELATNLPVGVFRYSNSDDQRFVESNPAFLTILGLNSTEALRCYQLQRLFESPDEWVTFGKLLKNNKQVRSFDFILKKIKGGTVDAAITAVMRSPQEGNYIDGIVEDISERKGSEYEIRSLNNRLLARSAELEAINGELEAFSYSVSHDLRGPLRAMDGFSKTLSNDYADKLDQRGQDRLNRIRAAAQRMGTLIDDLLNLARVSRTEIAWKPLDLTKIAGDIIAELKQSNPDRSVIFINQPRLVALGDDRLIRIVMTNLLENSWKFTAKSIMPCIEFGALSTGRDETYFVRDNGAGFDMAYSDKLFGAFQRLHDACEYAGTGIGLATVQRVVHKHSGRIWAESTVGKGATFFFTLGGALGEYNE